MVLVSSVFMVPPWSSAALKVFLPRFVVVLTSTTYNSLTRHRRGGENMAVSAKFKLSRITPWGGGLDGNGNMTDKVNTAEVELTPDYAEGRNKDWASATPSGVIRLTITNPEALAYFRAGQAYDVLITKNET